MKKVFGYIALSFMLTSCNVMFQWDSAETDPNRPSKEMIAKVSFQDVMTGVFQPKCIACHGSAGGVNLESAESASRYLQKISQSTLIEKRMPKRPYQPLTKEETLLLQAWIEAGGPDSPAVPSGPGQENPGQSPPPGDGNNPPQASELQPTFESIRKNILVPKCLICHKAGGEVAHIPLSTKSDLIDSPLEIVIPGNAEESMLMIVLQDGARKPMPPLDSGMTALSEKEKNVIEKWISEGAKD